MLFASTIYLIFWSSSLSLRGLNLTGVEVNNSSHKISISSLVSSNSTTFGTSFYDDSYIDSLIYPSLFI